jgi:hypothetical protein
MTTCKLTTLTATLALSMLACDARTLIGMVPDGAAPDAAQTNTGDGGMAAGDGGHTCTPVTFDNDAPYTLPAGVAGNWTGYFQGGSPLGNTDVVRFAIQQRADGTGEIHVTMGTAAPPPPATSATDYYPPGVQGPLFGLPTIIEGFSYTAHAVTWQGLRLKFLRPGAQPWESWCNLQTSYYVASRGDYNCVPGSGGSATYADAGSVCLSEDGTKQTQVPCPQFEMCNGYTCACDSCGCSASNVVTGDFDVTFDGNLVTGVGEGHNVRLTRDAP